MYSAAYQVLRYSRPRLNSAPDSCVWGAALMATPSARHSMHETACCLQVGTPLLCWSQGCINLTASSDVQEQQEKDEANAADPEALLRKREREAEEWRISQLRAGVSAEDNANLQVGFFAAALFAGNNVAGGLIQPKAYLLADDAKMQVCLMQQPHVLGKTPSLSSCRKRPCQAASSTFGPQGTVGPCTAAGWVSAEGQLNLLSAVRAAWPLGVGPCNRCFSLCLAGSLQRDEATSCMMTRILPADPQCPWWAVASRHRCPDCPTVWQSVCPCPLNLPLPACQCTCCCCPAAPCCGLACQAEGQQVQDCQAGGQGSGPLCSS